MASEQVNPVRNIAKRVKEIADEHGLNLLNFSLTPSLDESPDMVTLVMEFDPEHKKKEPDIVVMQANDELAKAMEEAANEERERKVQKARDDLGNLEDKMGGKQGFLDGLLDDE